MLLLVTTGVVMVQSALQVRAVAAGEFPLSGALRQLPHVIIGLIAMLVVMRLPIATFKRFAWAGMLIGLALQALVYTPLGYEFQGNRNWLRIGPVSLQPSELMKLALLVWIATVIDAKSRLLNRWVHVVIPVVPVVALSMIVGILGGDLGSLMVIAGLVLGCLFFAQIRMRVLLAIVALAALGIAVMTAIKPNRVMRVAHFMEVDCLSDPDEKYGLCWQTLHGFGALARGGWSGVGFGSSRSKWHWLPEAENDFIFAIIGEEAGLIGACAALAVFLVIAVTMLIALTRCHQKFTTALIGGALVWIIGQMVVNVAVVLGFVPVLGVPLPFVSAGGSSLISLLTAVGVVVACLRDESRRESASERESAASQTERARVELGLRSA
ncbi:peptidoglycan glycosyltransferase FtsW [Microbacterium imperiale]|uniref:peptidoglycan glycosyltransferase FtsW n=1 Tax=Microbacterium imperiale TaxID=33884 RepID=UPI001AEAF269|nr:putative peptidoglycan glycosyltransferase FtsW [Microbacterium imperiale]MBP2419395.1 cell division protein FtsW [Microbacterium imperiale]MDS0198735.1 putative lipid II flippase FtsW [Microbacterium imperiale]